MDEQQNKRLLDRAVRLARDVGGKLDLDAWVELWDGSRHPLGARPTGPFVLKIADSGVVASLLRRPTIDMLIELYVAKRIDFSGGTLLDFGRQLNRDGRSVKLGAMQKLRIAKDLAPFFLAPRAPLKAGTGGFEGEITGKGRKEGDNQRFISFHYDLSNEFYALFLDPEMVYTCAYYRDWSNDIASGADRQARHDLPEAAPRSPAIGSSTSAAAGVALVAHAAKNYGVLAHGVTLSEEQLDLRAARRSSAWASPVR